MNIPIYGAIPGFFSDGSPNFENVSPGRPSQTTHGRSEATRRPGGLTDGAEGMLEFQGEGRQRHIFRDRHDGHRGEVAGWVAGVPLAAGSVQAQLVPWKGEGKEKNPTGEDRRLREEASSPKLALM